MGVSRIRGGGEKGFVPCGPGASQRTATGFFFRAVIATCVNELERVFAKWQIRKLGKFETHCNQSEWGIHP